jgi:isopenicillin N synthase-like dioxygenase
MNEALGSAATAAEGIPVVAVSSLFGRPTPARERADHEIRAAAEGTGFLLVSALPAEVPQGAAVRAALREVFALPDGEKERLYRQKFAPGHPNLYRGWFPVQPGNLTSKEGIDLGADVAYGPGVCDATDPLREPTPLPSPSLLPGWHAAVRRYYLGFEALGLVLMRSLARSLGVPERHFDAPFERGLSTLRLIRYPVRMDLDAASAAEPSLWQERAGTRTYVTGAPHVDSGFLTLLAQDGVPGLQARHRSGAWMDVPPLEGTLAVNFGLTLERWSAGRIRATEHRVLGTGRERYSIPFFYEARADAEIRPLPIDDPGAFTPFLYGDHLWATTTQYVEFRGMGPLRPPRGR